MKAFFLSIICSMLSMFFCGCGPSLRVEQAGPIVAGKASIAEAAEVLNARRLAMIPIRSSGELFYEEFEDGKRGENFRFTATLRFVPERRIYFRCKSLVGEAIHLGGNADEFWLRMKPKEVSRYWSGNWDDLDGCGRQLLLSPLIMLEALGMVSVDGSWVLENEAGFDVLTKYSNAMKPLKKVYVRTSDYLIERIEYFSGSPRPQVQVELGEYKHVAANVSVPGRITVLSFDADVLTSKVGIRLKGIRVFEPNKKQLAVLFEPDPKGVKYVYRLDTNCEFVPQEQKGKR
jgi:hypothetical protein